MMRAMMSNRTGRAWRTSWAGALDREAEAMIEARRILAAVEPAGGYYDSITYCLTCGSAVAGVAIAEALEALLAAPAMAEYLAERQAGGAR